MDLLQQFKDYIQQQHLFTTKDVLLLAVSGGADSVVLCELCKQAGYNFAIAHCNFKLRGSESDRDENFVKQLAAEYAVPFYVTQFETAAIAKKEKKSVEEAARDLRYNWFEKLRAENNYSFIVTAHHANDNIETVLMNFFRGTGIKGLHGILPKQEKIIRPLMFAKKDEILAFAAAQSLHFVTDSTNADNDFTRNYFRNELLPSVKKVFPAVEENVLKNITRLGEVEQLYQQAIVFNKKQLVEHKNNEVHIPVLKLKQKTSLNTVLYEIIKDYGFTANQTNDVASLLNSESGKYVASPTHRIIRNRKWLIITPNKTEEAATILIEENDAKINFERGELEITQTSNNQYSILNNQLIAQLNTAEIQFPLLLRKWKQGDYFYPLGMQKKKKLSRFFIDQKLSIADKEKIWVLESNKKIAWVIGLRIDDRFKITTQTKNVLTAKMRML